MSSLIIFATLIIIFLWAICNCINRNTWQVQPQTARGRRKEEKVPFTFVQNIINKFNGQRQVGDQFAVVVLSNEKELSNIGRMRYRPCDDFNNSLVDSRRTFNPPLDTCENYIVARPGRVRDRFLNRSAHAEEIILLQLKSLLKANRSRRSRAERHDPTFIVLYSWMMPCSTCTRAIIKQSKSLNSKIVVVYTIDWKWMNDDENVINRAHLREAGIMVQKGWYSFPLPPAV